MADAENRPDALGNSEERYKYIGFEVFPGKAGDIFKNDEERKTLIQKVMSKFNRSEGEVRDRCTLIEERISKLEKGFMALASIVLILSIFLPWFSGYYEIESFKLVSEDSSAALAAGSGQEASHEGAAATDSTEAAQQDTTEAVVAEAAGGANAADSALAGGMVDTTRAVMAEQNIDTAAVLAGRIPAPKGMTRISVIDHDHRSITGIGALLNVGEYASDAFSSGFVLMISFILMLVYFLSCLGIGVYNLYLIYGVKMKDPDKYALMLKSKLKINWIPALMLLLILLLSLIGSNYGFDSGNMISQIGDSYNTVTLLGIVASGILVSLGGFLVVAFKAKEI